MTNDLTPITSGPMAEFIKELNLPHLIAGDAGKALSRLIAGAVDIPAALLQEKVQAIKDRTDAKSVVTKAMANHIAKSAVTNPEIVDRALNSLVSKEFRNLENKAAIATKTIEHLKEKTDQDDPPDSAPSARAEIDEDWLNIFERYAEDASSDRLRETWARVLAGEIRKPRTFSLKTLRFIAELDQPTATTFEKYAGQIVANNILPAFKDEQVFGELLQLQDAGLLQGVGGHLRKKFQLRQTVPTDTIGAAFIPCGKEHIFVKGKADIICNVSGMVVTRVGMEIAGVIRKPFDHKVVDKLVEQIDKKDLESMILGKILVKDGMERFVTTRPLWKKDTDAT